MILLSPTSWEIRQTALKGNGVFAKKVLQAGTVVSDYIGMVLRTATDDTSEKNGLYLMYYHDNASLYPQDLTVPGAHFINHSCMPNCWVYTYYGHTLFFTLRKIFPGEELTIKYLLPPVDTCRNCTHQCSCGMNNCTGTMHLTSKRFAAWHKFSEGQAKRTKRKRISYHKPLKPLAIYPRNIEDNPLYDLFGALQQPSLTLTTKNKLSVERTRACMRETGQTIYLPHLQKTILGIQDNTFIYQQ